MTLTQPSTLDPELQRAIFEGPLGPMIKHPLVNTLVYGGTDMETALYNQQLAGKRELLQKLQSQGRFSRMLWLYERPFRMDALRDLWDHFKSDVSRACAFREVWTDAENLWQTKDVWTALAESIEDPEVWHRAMAEVPEDLAVFRALSFPLTVHRGCVVGENEDGLSWTIDYGIAEWFADRYTRDGEVVTRTLDLPEDILFYYGGRNECEVVLNPTLFS